MDKIHKKKDVKMMNCCFIIGSMSYSGAEKVFNIITQELANRGNTVSIILLGRQQGVEEHGTIKIFGAKTSGNRLQRIKSRMSGIKSIVNQINPDVIVSFGYVCNLNTIVSCHGSHIPVVIAERNDPEYDPRNRSVRFLRTVLYRFANGFVFQTNEIQKYFSKTIQKKSIIIPNPVVNPGKMWCAENTRKIIVTTARLDDYQKNHYLMMDAFFDFYQTNKDYNLYIYGDGPDRNAYQEYIDRNAMNKCVFLMGKTNNSIDSIIDCEVFLLTSKFEGMPNSLLEALSIGMPCVATDCGGGGAKYLFEKANSGLIVSSDVKSISRALEELVSDRSKELLFSNNAMSIVDSLSIKGVCDKWEQYLSSLIVKK